MFYINCMFDIVFSVYETGEKTAKRKLDVKKGKFDNGKANFETFESKNGIR